MVERVPGQEKCRAGRGCVGLGSFMGSLGGAMLAGRSYGLFKDYVGGSQEGMGCTAWAGRKTSRGVQGLHGREDIRWSTRLDGEEDMRWSASLRQKRRHEVEHSEGVSKTGSLHTTAMT